MQIVRDGNHLLVKIVKHKIACKCRELWIIHSDSLGYLLEKQAAC